MSWKWAAVLALCGLMALPAAAAETKGAAKAVAPPAGAATSIAVGLIGVPVLSVKKVRAYEYGIVAVRVGDVAKYMKQVCDKRYDLTDAFLAVLHAKPFATGADIDGVRALQDMLKAAREVVGGDFITAVDVSWSKAPRPLDPAVFPNNTAVNCKT